MNCSRTKKAADHERHTLPIQDGTNRLACNNTLSTRTPGWSILVRLLVGLVVFLPEGIQKLASPGRPGAGPIAKIGIAYPELRGPFVGAVEIVCGTLVVLGLLTRLAAIPLIIIVVVAIV